MTRAKRDLLERIDEELEWQDHGGAPRSDDLAALLRESREEVRRLRERAAGAAPRPPAKVYVCYNDYPYDSIELQFVTSSEERARAWAGQKKRKSPYPGFQEFDLEGEE